MSFSTALRVLLTSDANSAVTTIFSNNNKAYKDLRLGRYVRTTIDDLALDPATTPLAEAIVALAAQHAFVIPPTVASSRKRAHPVADAPDLIEFDQGLGLSLSPEDEAFIRSLDNPSPRTVYAAIPHAIVVEALRVSVRRYPGKPIEHPISDGMQAALCLAAAEFAVAVDPARPTALFVPDIASEVDGLFFCAGIPCNLRSYDACLLAIQSSRDPAAFSILRDFVCSWAVAIGQDMWTAVAAARGIPAFSESQMIACSVALLMYIQVNAFVLADTPSPDRGARFVFAK
jgi:hypothetical protein